jgi:hypothetical protein
LPRYAYRLKRGAGLKLAKDSSNPIYSEAYPCFDVVAAKAALDREPSVCVFKLGRLEVGQLVVAEVADSSLLIAS